MFRDDFRVLRADRLVIGNARGRNLDPGEGTHMRLDFANLLSGQPRYRKLVFESALEQLFQERQFRIFGRHDYFAANLVADAVLAAELHHGSAALARKFGLVTAGLVINAGMDNTAIPTALVAGERGFLLEEHDAGAAVPLG